MTRCDELRLVFTILTSLLIGMQADVKTDKYEYDGNTIVPKNVTGCQVEKTGIMLNAIRISKNSKEIALPHDIKNNGQLELWTEFANRCNGKRQCQLNQMKLLQKNPDTVLPSSETNTTFEIEFNCKPIGGDKVYHIATNFSQVLNKVGSSSVYLMYNKTSKNKIECYVKADAGNLTVELLHFQLIPISNCMNFTYNISIYRQGFNCSWTTTKKAITVPQPQNIPIESLEQTGFVWLEVQTEVKHSRTTQLNLTCNLEPTTTSSSVTSVTNENSQTVSSTASSTASISTSTRNNDTTTTTRSHQTTLDTMNISSQLSVSTKETSSRTSATTTNPQPTVTPTTTDMGAAPETTSNTSSLSSAPDKREATKSNDTGTLVHIAIGVGVTAFLVLVLVIALCVIYLRQRKSEELSMNPKRTSIDGVLTMKEDYETSLYTKVGINQGSAPKETDQLPMSAVAASLPSTCKSNTETQSPDVEYAAVNKSKKGSNPMVDPSNKDMNQFPNAEYATVNKVSTILSAMPEKSSLNETQFPNAEYASVNKVNKSSNLLLETSNANESNFSNQESAVENKVTKSPHPKPAHKKSSTLPNYINVKTPNTETPESLYSHLSHMKSANARETENIYNG
uniref:Grctm6 protein n=1 Tax=Biomphalaria glabrata TaxID=6526 RepID=A0A0C9RP82_BIOGL